MPTAALQRSNINPPQFVPRQDYADETTLLRYLVGADTGWEAAFVCWRLADTSN